MNTKAFIFVAALVFLIAAVNAQTTANPTIASLVSKASSIAAGATNTQPATTSTSGAMSLNTGFSNSQLSLYALVIVAVTLIFA